MTSQEKKQYLRRYRKLFEAIEQKTEEVAQLKALCTKVTASLGGMPRGGSSARDDRYNALIDLKRELSNEVWQLKKTLDQIERSLDSVDDETLKTLLRYRYINGATWEVIAERLHFSRRHVTSLHGRALVQYTPSSVP